MNLATGEEIKLEELFVSSAPINLYLANGLYEILAWEDGRDAYDMSKVDTSSYEDKFLLLAKNYAKNKVDLKYIITADKITVFGLIDKNIIDCENPENFDITIDLTKCIDEVAMYKRFLTDQQIYDNTSFGIKDTIVFIPTNNLEERR